MTRTTVIGSLFTLALIALSAAAQARDLLIENVTIVSPESGKPLTAHWVLIREGRIAQISNKRIAAPGVRSVSGRGKYLTPGLMDSHVHVTSTPGLPMSADPQLMEAYTKQQPRSYLYFGVTQLLDLAGSPEGIEAFEAQPQRPDLFRCGAAPVLGGYPMVLMDDARRYEMVPNYIYEPENAARHPLPTGANAADHTPEAVVNRIAASGARCVKIFIEDGFGDRSDWPMLSKQSMQRVRAAATERGLLLIGHANALGMQRIAVEVQVDVIAHGLWNWDEETGKQGVPQGIAAHLRDVVARGIGMQPTLRVLPGIADMFRADTLKDPSYAKVVPPALLAWYSTDAGQWFKREMQRDFGDAPDTKIVSGYIKSADQGMRSAKYLYELGQPMLLGSDTPSAPTYGNQPGYDTYREMRWMAQAGIALPDIFRAATINNSRRFRLDKDYGTVSIGKIANLLLLDANPLETLRAWTQIDKVVLHGTAIERESLAADRAAH